MGGVPVAIRVVLYAGVGGWSVSGATSTGGAVLPRTFPLPLLQDGCHDCRRHSIHRLLLVALLCGVEEVDERGKRGGVLSVRYGDWKGVISGGVWGVDVFSWVMIRIFSFVVQFGITMKQQQCDA